MPINSLKPVVQKTGTDTLFGSGVDGTVVISTTTHITRDMYYENLTVNSGFTLFTNGYKVFVKGTLTNNGVVGMPAGMSQTTSVLAGTVNTRSDSSVTVSDGESLDGSLGFAQVKGLEVILSGVRQMSGGVSRFRSGRRGSQGATGSGGSAGATGASGSANPGSAGSGGNAGYGNPGSAGAGGTGGSAGSGGDGGAGGDGGGTVVVVAKTITGSGTFESAGTVGSAGGSGGAGSAGSGGGSGTSGNAGANAPGNAHHNPTGTGHAHTCCTGSTLSFHPGHNHDYVCGSYTDISHCAHTHPGGSCGAHCGNGGCWSHHPAWHHNNVCTHHNPGHYHHNASHHHSHSHSNPGNVSHNPTYYGGAGGTANPGSSGGSGNPGASGGAGDNGGSGALFVLTRGITTHVASGSKTLVRDLDA